MTKWFGKNWGAPVCCDTEHAPTPVGALCLHCDEPIEPLDDGFIIPCVEPDGVHDRPWHYECHMRGITGSVAHVLKTCSCYVTGASETDPPELTLRQAARLAVELWEASNALRRD